MDKNSYEQFKYRTYGLNDWALEQDMTPQEHQYWENLFQQQKTEVKKQVSDKDKRDNDNGK